MPEPLKHALVALRKEETSSVGGRTPDEGPSQHGLLLALALVIPVVVTLSTALWLRSAYTSHVFHLQGFLGQYSSGIYRYRILGREILLSTYRMLASHHADRPFSMPTDPDATLLFYGAYVLLNAICFFFSNLALLLLLGDWKQGISDLHLALYFFLVFLLALSAYTVTPYDQLAYLLMLACFLSLRLRSRWAVYLILGIAAITGTLNRETEYLVTPALLTVAWFAAPREAKQYYYTGFYHLLLFAGCYLGLRIFLPGVPMVAAGITLGGKWALSGLIVLSTLFYIGLTLVAKEYRDRKPALVLLLLSTPYIVTIILSGELRELRLLLPLLLCLVFVYVQLTALRPPTPALDANRS